MRRVGESDDRGPRSRLLYRTALGARARRARSQPWCSASLSRSRRLPSTSAGVPSISRRTSKLANTRRRATSRSAALTVALNPLVPNWTRAASRASISTSTVVRGMGIRVTHQLGRMPPASPEERCPGASARSWDPEPSGDPERGPTLSPVPPGCAGGDDHLRDVWRVPVAKVNDARAKRLRLDQLQVDPFVQGREVGRAASE